MKRFVGVLALVMTVAAILGVSFLLVSDWQISNGRVEVVAELLDLFDTAATPTDVAPRIFTVTEGETATSIADRLQDRGLISHAIVFKLMAQAKGVSAALSVGEYDISPGMKPSEILSLLAAGKTRPVPMVTIPEGWRAEEIAEKLDSLRPGSADRFMKAVRLGNSSSSATASRPPGASLEGYLFPETYTFDSKTTESMMADRMVEQFDRRFDASMRAKAEEMHMTIHQMVTLASIIEREAVVPSERPLMAGVFYNRLREGIPLQSDPTVQYAVASSDPASQRQFGWWKTQLSQEDLQLDSPYNSYRYPGLPPGPICNPGAASLQAAVEPESSGFFYFVAKPDGSHAFSSTLEEHNENVARYR